MNVPVLRDEFETVKQLLASAATYAESANRQGEQNSRAIAQLEVQVSELKDAQKKTDAQLQQLTQRVDSLTQRVDSFVFESQRLFTQQGQTINKLDAMISRYDGVLAYLMRKDHPEMD